MCLPCLKFSDLLPETHLFLFGLIIQGQLGSFKSSKGINIEAKFSKQSNTVSLLKSQTLFSFCFLEKILVIRVRIHKMLHRMANREDPDQTASSEAV